MCGRYASTRDPATLAVPAQTWEAWLEPDCDDPSELLASPLTQLVRALELRPVSTTVNDVRRGGPALVERVQPEQPALLDLDQVR